MVGGDGKLLRVFIVRDIAHFHVKLHVLFKQIVVVLRHASHHVLENGLSGHVSGESLPLAVVILERVIVKLERLLGTINPKSFVPEEYL